MNRRNHPYYGWMIVGIAALSMVATLPGRTVGLGLITEPLLTDLGLQRTEFARLNLFATLIGSLFAFVAGPLTDRWGIRLVLSTILFLLGSLVMTMSQTVTAASVAGFLILTRGVGQTALSTTAITSVGKWFTRRLALAMGVFSIIVALGFSAAIVISQAQIASLGWRKVWLVIGASVFTLGIISSLLLRREPEEIEHLVDPQTDNEALSASMRSLNLFEALSSPCFWIFGIGMALYGGVLAGVSLFNESILQELGFGASTFRYAMAGLMGAGLLGNLTAAWAARYITLPRIMSASLAVIAIVLWSYSHLNSPTHVIAHACLYGFCGGVFSVLFFTGFGLAFGRTHLGKIQGCAQVLAVFASALGPWCLANVQVQTGSYFPAMNWAAPAFAIVAVCAWFTRLPARS